VQILSVGKVGECINVEVGYEEDVLLTMPTEVGQLSAGNQPLLT